MRIEYSKLKRTCPEQAPAEPDGFRGVVEPKALTHRARPDAGVSHGASWDTVAFFFLSL